MSLTPAMTLFDVDGSLPPAALAEAGAAAAARAIRRFGITGSIGIDLPTLPRGPETGGRAALDAILPQPFERTAVNGFGFLQIVRRRERPSMPELLQADPAGAAARALLRRAERLTGAVTLHAAPAVIAGSRKNGSRRSLAASAAPSPCGRSRGSPYRRAMSKAAPDSCPLCGKPAERSAQAVLQPGLPRPRPAELARRGLSRARPARRSGPAAGREDGLDSER